MSEKKKKKKKNREKGKKHEWPLPCHLFEDERYIGVVFVNRN